VLTESSRSRKKGCRVRARREKLGGVDLKEKRGGGNKRNILGRKYLPFNHRAERRRERRLRGGSLERSNQ